MTHDLEATLQVTARGPTEQIKSGIESVWELITRAYSLRVWDVLGYASWDDYCTGEFGQTRLCLPREKPDEVVLSLRECGLSLRAIASATGESKDTIRRSLSGVANETPELESAAAEPDADALAETLIEVEPPAPVIGIDGKRYQPARPKPRRRPLTETAAGIASDMEKLRGRINGLIDDDRFTANTEGIAGRLWRYEVWLSEAIARLHESLGGDPDDRR